MSRRWLVFTDLDGTLLDRDSYSLEAARPALAALRQRCIPVIPVTSKTLAEIAPLQAVMGDTGPAIIENGAAVLIPQHQAELASADARREGEWLLHWFGLPRAQIIDCLNQLRREPAFRFEGFADWSSATLAHHTGLSQTAARRAQQRLASEPLLWQGSDEALQRFRQALSEAGLRLLQGGRFWHVMGSFDKADAVHWLCERYRRLLREPVATIVLGDSHNDLGMLDAADVAVIIASAHSAELQPKRPPRVLRSHLPGPAGWCECILELLRDIAPDAGKRTGSPSPR